MFGKQFMSTVSVMIVLLILGVFGVIAVVAGEFSNSLKSRMGFTVVMSDVANESAVKSVESRLAASSYVNEMKFTSTQEIMEAWERDNGENIMEILGVNPFGSEFEVTVVPEYATRDSLVNIVNSLKSMEGVEEISTTTHIVDGINRIMHILSIVMLPLALALLLVSAVLINNTIRLTVYSSRFLIHTMRLVGATGKFIRRPFIRSGIINGLVAGITSSLLLWIAIRILNSALPDLGTFTSLNAIGWIFPAMIAGGILICGIAAAMATNKYLRLNYDDMFR